MSTNAAPILIAGSWRASRQLEQFHAHNPALGAALPEPYPISAREDVLEMVQAGSEAADALRNTSGAKIAGFLEAVAAGIERQADALVEIAHTETALPGTPRLKDVELMRTRPRAPPGKAHGGGPFVTRRKRSIPNLHRWAGRWW
jgi:2,5-dioxopentanoate dehydrogenase